jgi:hypothetical protein
MFATSPADYLYAGVVLVFLFGTILVVGAGAVILAAEMMRLMRMRRAMQNRTGERRGGQGGQGATDPPFWCWQTVVVYMGVVWLLGGLLEVYGFDPVDRPLPLLVCGLSFGLGLTLWDRRQRNRRRGSQASEKQKETI